MNHPPHIEHYAFGSMRIDGAGHANDLKIIGGEVRGDWWRESGHLLRAEDIGDVLEAGPEVLVVGTGSNGRMRLADDLPARLEKAGIRLVVEPTKQAAQSYNRLAGEGRNVAAAFHLTC